MKINWIQMCLIVLLFLGSADLASAATLRLSPETGVYSSGNSFSVQVLINTDNKPVNASDGQISFNPKELQVVGVNRSNSIFNLWTEEPAFSNSLGTVTFGGGSPSGYKGTNGSIITITFRSLGSGSPKVQFKSGSILAADGLGTNILTSMNGGVYTISVPTENPEPEYITPPNTPAAPVVTSASHSDQSMWYSATTAVVSWTVPKDVIALRTLLDNSPITIPTKEFTDVITERTIDDLDQGTSYFHIQFKNQAGWGKIAHYKINVDSEKPSSFNIVGVVGEKPEDPIYALRFTVDDISPIQSYAIKLDNDEPFVFTDTENVKSYSFEKLTPGYHSVIVEAFDSTHNSIISTISFTIEALEKPSFNEYPTRINTEVIPALKGKTMPNARVAIVVKKVSDGSVVDLAYGNSGVDQFSIVASEEGEFIFIPNSAFERGVYSITAIAKDSRGRLSEESDPIKLIVEAPGYVVFGTIMINILSVLVPLTTMVLVLIFGCWYLSHKFKVWRRKLKKETLEAESSLTLEFSTIVKNLDHNVFALKESRKGKLTKAETDLIEQIEADLKNAQVRIEKEITDIEDTIS